MYVLVSVSLKCVIYENENRVRSKCSVVITKATASTQATPSKIIIGKCKIITIYRYGRAGYIVRKKWKLLAYPT